jgi:glyoxylase-like metal-dependent hydrolase (beta-lactamase superfamily II)
MKKLFILPVFVLFVLSCATTADKKELASVPMSAYGPAVPQDKGYLVEEVRDGVYWVTEGAYQVMFITTGEGVIVVDAPPNIGEKILQAVAEVTDEPITHVIYSHSHADHIGAAALYPEGAVIIAHEDTRDQLERVLSGSRSFPYGVFVGGSPPPLPTISFTDRYELKVGSQTLILEYHGANHEPGNIFIYAPRQKVLMLVDVVFPGWVPFKDLALAEDIQGFLDAHDKVLEYEFDVFVGGHLTRLGTREDVQIQKEYISDIVANAGTALQTVDFMAIAQEQGFENPWNLFDVYLDAVAEKTAELTLAKWNGRLGGADVWTKDHSFRILESLRIE